MEVSYEDSKRFWKEKGIATHAPEWLKYIALTRPDFASYLFYMRERLQACQKVLKKTGSIYLHCDWRASGYLRMIMDEVFGFNNFINEIIWWYKTGGATTAVAAHVYFAAVGVKKPPSEIGTTGILDYDQSVRAHRYFPFTYGSYKFCDVSEGQGLVPVIDQDKIISATAHFKEIYH